MMKPFESSTGRQDTPEMDLPDDISERYLASDNPEEDPTFVPVSMRIDHVLSNVPRDI